MPNGGYLSCGRCTYNRAKPGHCDLFGVEVSVHTICRGFRAPQQSHTEARREHPFLENLAPGVVYGFANDPYMMEEPAPIYRTARVPEPVRDEEVFQFQERMDTLFSSGGPWVHRTLRTLFDPASQEWNETTAEEKIRIVKKLIGNAEGIYPLALEYRESYSHVGREDIARDTFFGLTELLTLAVEDKGN